MLKQTQPRLSQLASAVAVVLGGITLLPAAHAAAPTAGTNISNIAVANYVDASGAPQTVNSNAVSTTVLQVASFTLVDDRTTDANQNTTVTLSHVLTNTGNGSDTFTLNLANVANGTGADNLDLTNIGIYLDSNGDGAPDDQNANLMGQTITLAPGQSANLLVQGITPNESTNGQISQLTLTATSGFAPTLTETDTDTITIVGGPVIELKKTAAVAIGADNLIGSGDTITYTIEYTNKGNGPGVDVVITDLLPANVTYVPGSATWSNQAGALTDAADATDTYTFDSAGRELTFTLPTLAANVTGRITFQVTIDPNAPVGNIVNTALVDYDDGNPATPPIVDKPSNPIPVAVAPNRLGTINDEAADDYSDAERTATLDDTQTIATIPQGGTAAYTTYVHNTGNVSQVYEVTVDTTDLPAGTTVTLLRNGAPLTNISGTSAVDIGPVAPGETVELQVELKFPANFTETDPANTSTATVTISPVGNEAATDSTILEVGNVAPATVDLTNGNSAIDYNDPALVPYPDSGEGPNQPGVVVDEASTTPGEPVTFPVEIFNGGNSPTSYDLTATVPPGWTVVFIDPATGLPVTDTGNILPGETKELIAVVTPPDNALVDPTNEVVLTVTSPSGVTDSMTNNVAITEDRALTFVADNEGKVGPGGSVVYTHTLTNDGNIVEGDAPGELPLTITQGGSFTGTVTVAIDLDNDGLIDPNEIVQNNDLNSVLPGGLQPFTSYPVLVKVEAPVGTPLGQQNITTVTVTPTGDVNGVAAPAVVDVVDTTTVSTPVRVYKTQALDANCDGVADGGAASYTTGVISAAPAQCVVYRVRAVNEGDQGVTAVVITDATPAFTTVDTTATAIVNGAAPVPATVPGTENQAGTVRHDVGALAPGAEAELNFGVEIDQ